MYGVPSIALSLVDGSVERNDIVIYGNEGGTKDGITVLQNKFFNQQELSEDNIVCWRQPI